MIGVCRNIGEVRREACQLLANNPYFGAFAEDSIALEVDALLMHVLQKTRAQLVISSREEISPKSIELFRELLERRLNLEPFAYISGKREFYGLEFEVTHDVLIPRPETEMLVDLAVNELVCSHKPTVLVDIGVGSGAIIISIMSELYRMRRLKSEDASFGWLNESQFFATDISAGALAVAKRNAHKYGVSERLNFLEGKYFASLGQAAVRDLQFVVVSNPPYLAFDDEVSPEVKCYEPECALFCAEGGLEIFRGIVSELKEKGLRPQYLAVEIAPAQMQKAYGILQTAGFDQIEFHRDYANKERVISARCV